MQFLKENYDMIGLLIGVVGVVLAVFSLVDEVKKKRTREKLEREKKEKEKEKKEEEDKERETALAKAREEEEEKEIIKGEKKS